eukprot:scaffold139098_cov22-Tisochrysis_lutea.AAC.2
MHKSLRARSNRPVLAACMRLGRTTSQRVGTEDRRSKQEWAQRVGIDDEQFHSEGTEGGHSHRALAHTEWASITCPLLHTKLTSLLTKSKRRGWTVSQS